MGEDVVILIGDKIMIMVRMDSILTLGDEGFCWRGATKPRGIVSWWIL